MDSLREYTESLTDINNKLIHCCENSSDIRDELLRSKKIFEQQAEDLTRKIAWVTIHVFSHVSLLDHPYGEERREFSSRRNVEILLFYIDVFIVHYTSLPKQEIYLLSYQKSI